jgi:microcin C transport system permease protein
MRFPFRLKLSPITRKRWVRFRGIKRAYWSFWALVILYVISLGSELICNDRPLYLRYEGKSYFPAFRYYPQSTFVPGAPDTRCDYHALASRPEFRDQPENYMRWAPVSYGPNQVVAPDRIRIPDRVKLKLIPWIPSAEIRVDADFRVVLAGYGSGRFFGVDDEQVAGLELADFFRLPTGLRQAADARFAGEAVPSNQWECLRQSEHPGPPVQLRLSTFKAAAGHRRQLIKVTLRENAGKGNKPVLFTFDKEQNLVKGDAARWAAIPDEVRDTLRESLSKAMGDPVEPFLVDTGEGGRSCATRFVRCRGTVSGWMTRVAMSSLACCTACARP